MAPRGLNVEDCVWNSILLYSYYWICTDCNKDLIYGNDFFFLLPPWLFWCSSCNYYWSWFNCRCYCCHFCNVVVINASLFRSIWHLLCIIMFPVLSRLFLCHCCFCCFVVAVFFIVLVDAAVVACRFLLLLSLLLHGCCWDHCYRCHGGCWRCFCFCSCCVLLPVLHHCFALFYGFLISLGLSSH